MSLPPSGSDGDSRRVFVPSPSPQGPPAAARQPPLRLPAPPASPRRGHPPAYPPQRGPVPGDRPGRRSDRPPPDEARPGKKRVRWRWVALITAAVLVLGLLGVYLWLWSVFGRVDRVEVSPVLSTGGEGTNYLIVGSDAREGLAEDALAFDSAGPGGQRADTIMVLHFGGDGAKIMSIPRDLYIPIADGGGNGKINAAYNGGPQRLTKTVTDSLGLPIHRYMEVDFVSFAGLVDGLGGITVEFPHPAMDQQSGLWVTESGPVELDGEQALAYVRSRNYTEFIDGREVVDPTGDLGRVQRQQAFLTAVFSKLGDTRNPLALGRSLSNVSAGLRIDDKMSMWDALRLGWNLRGLDPVPVELPADIGRNEAGSVLFLREAEAQPVLDQFR